MSWLKSFGIIIYILSAIYGCEKVGQPLFLSTTGRFILYGWTGDRAIGTKNTAIAFFRSNYFVTVFTFIKVLASIGWHFFLFLVPTFGTGNGR